MWGTIHIAKKLWKCKITESLALTVQKMAQAQKFVHFAPKEFLNHVGT